MNVCNFGRWHYGELSCEKYVGGHFVQWSSTICTILVEGINYGEH